MDHRFCHCSVDRTVAEVADIAAHYVGVMIKNNPQYIESHFDKVRRPTAWRLGPSSYMSKTARVPISCRFRRGGTVCDARMVLI